MTSGSLTVDSALSGPCFSTAGSAHWTLPWPPLGPHAAALRLVTPRALLGFCVRPSVSHEFSGWDSPYVHDTVVVLGQDAGATALGSAFGTREQMNARAWESVRRV